MGACKAPIFNLLLTSSPSSSSSTLKPLIPISRTPLLTRRLVLLSLPLATFLLPSNTPAVEAIDSTSSSSDVTTFNPISDAERDASAAISRRISEALDLLEKGRDFQASGDFNQALVSFTQVIEKYKEFAFSDYARVGRALTLYEVGNRDDAIAEMEDVSISLKGYPEVHAALAAALYVDKHAPLLAENQFTIATLLDPHYTDLSYVKDTKHWPPSLGVVSESHIDGRLENGKVAPKGRLVSHLSLQSGVFIALFSNFGIAVEYSPKGPYLMCFVCKAISLIPIFANGDILYGVSAGPPWSNSTPSSSVSTFVRLAFFLWRRCSTFDSGPKVCSASLVM